MKPIFIGGCPRSGTTLLGSILGSHSLAVCTPESQFKTSWLGAAEQRDGRLDRGLVLRSLEHSFRFALWKLDLEAVADELPDAVDVGSVLMALATAYASANGRPGAQVWVDHTPNNIRYFLHLAARLPDVHLVHIVRDPRGVTASLKPLDWGPNHSATCADFWVQQIAFGLAAEEHLGRRVSRVRYEDLVAEPEATVRRLCRNTGLDFDPKMLAGDGFHTPAYSRRQHRLVGAGPDQSRAEAWKGALGAREVELVEAATCDLLETLGYRAFYGPAARPMTGVERLRCSLRELLWTEVVNRWRLRRRRAAAA